MTHDLPAGTPAFLSTLRPTRGDIRLAGAVLFFSFLVFAVTAPFAKTPLAQVWPFIPAYQSAVVVCDVLTAALLFGQYLILRAPALAVLAAGYLFTGLMAAVHALTFPGLFAPQGLLGAGPQSTAWLYMFWHGGFPLCVIAYALSKDGVARVHARVHPMAVLAGSVAAVSCVVAGLAGLATAGQQLLPPIMQGNRYTPAMIVVVSTVWSLSALALVALWRKRPHSVIDLWLMVVCCAWLFDIALSAVLNAGRFDLGFYAGRLYGLLAASFVLGVLLLENGRLYAGLVGAHEREVGKNNELQGVKEALEAANRVLGERNRQLQAATQMKSEFVANMSHELRTPLNAIIGFSELLKDGMLGGLTAEQKEAVSHIFSGGEHLLGLINDILDLSKVEAGKMTLDLERLDVEPLLRDCLSTFSEKAARQQVVLRFESGVESAPLLADARKLRQIVYNLISNALKFTNAGGEIRLTTRRVAGREATLQAPAEMATRLLPLPAGEFGQFLEIRVCDDGIGIAAEHLPRLFETFRQIDSEQGRRHRGSGLGLALVHAFATLHSGTVGIASAPGRGTQIAVWLPLRTGAEVTAGATTSAGAPAVDAGSAPDGRRHALVIEDNAQAAQLLRIHLESMGFSVHCAPDAANAVEAASQRRPDLITLDLILPDANGWDVLERLKADPRLASVPVVIVSIAADEQKGVAVGTAKLLQKPVTREALLDALHALDVRPLPQRPLTAMVVDDDRRAVELVARHLEEQHCEVLRAYDGRTAVDTARRVRPDLMILDLMMPEMSGFEVVDALKQRSETASIPILVVTSKTLTQHDRARLNAHALRTVAKGAFDRQQFLHEVGRALR